MTTPADRITALLDARAASFTAPLDDSDGMGDLFSTPAVAAYPEGHPTQITIGGDIGPQMKRQARERALPKASSVKGRILLLLEAAAPHGYTRSELVGLLNVSLNTVNPRCRELIDAGAIQAVSSRNGEGVLVRSRRIQEWEAVP